MDCAKVGRLIYRLRHEKGMTQRVLADALGVSDKAISKWERGLGCPDVTLLRALSAVLGADIGSELALEIHAALQAAGIEIPFPQRDLHIRSVDAGVVAAVAPTATSTLAERNA